jgi:hypothetical protein
MLPFLFWRDVHALEIAQQYNIILQNWQEKYRKRN